MKVTVVTPVYNGALTIERCIKSVLAQDYQLVEHVVIDGGSTDGTIDILQKYGVRHVSEKDSGIYHAMNKGICLAEGDCIHILNADDFYISNSVVSEVVEFMKAGNFDFVHAYINQVTEKRNLRVGGDFGINKLKNSMKVAHPSCFIKRSVYDTYGNYSQGFKIAADYDFILRVWDRVSIGFLNKTIVEMDGNGLSNASAIKSYKNSLAVHLAHNYSILYALNNFIFQLFRHYISRIVR